jgi:hypothetical protein
MVSRSTPVDIIDTEFGYLVHDRHQIRCVRSIDPRSAPKTHIDPGYVFIDHGRQAKTWMMPLESL